MNSLVLRIDETNGKIDAINQELSKRIDETNRKIDTINQELNKRIDETNKRIDALSKRLDRTNKRTDDVVSEFSEIKADLREMKTRDKIMNDLIKRIQKLEDKVFA